MKSSHLFLASAAALAFALLAYAKAADAGSAKSPAAAPALVERGRYLVTQVGMCGDCHTPRNEKGELVAAKQLQGAPLGFAPTAPMPWMAVSPRIAGLPVNFTAQDTIHFLMTGERPAGRTPVLPPMPAFRFDRADAEAITAYLQTLPTGAP